jgi:hypothetical protein
MNCEWEVRGVLRLCMRTDRHMILNLQIGNRPPPGHTEKDNTLEPKHPIDAILDALASQQRQGENSLIVTIEPGLIQDAMNALRDYRKLFAPVIPGMTDIQPIYAAYEEMRQADVPEHTILLFVECQTIEEWREALGRLPIRHSSEWRRLDSEWSSLNKSL